LFLAKVANPFSGGSFEKYIMNEIWIETEYGNVYGKSMGDPNAPLILGIHGMSERNGAHTWEPMLQPLAEAGYYAVSVDMPGWGKSPEWRRLKTQPTSAVVWAIIAIMDGLNAEKATLMGKSWGGGVALATTLVHPERVERLILTAPAYPDFSRLVGISQEMLMAWAEDDEVIPFNYAGIFKAVIANIQLETYPTGGHDAAIENIEDFAPKAIRFLAGEKPETDIPDSDDIDPDDLDDDDDIDDDDDDDSDD
jgi:pimeloyl-ACP methyl ester carboxylesterase